MKKIGFLLLSLFAAFSFTACKTDGGTDQELPREKKLTQSKVEYVGNVEGTDLQRYIVDLWSSKSTKADDFSKADIELTMEIVTTKALNYDALAAGNYAFAATAKEALTIVDSENSTLNVTKGSTYGGDKARINGGEITVAFFSGKYEIKGEITDAKGRTLEFSFFDVLNFVPFTPVPSAIIDFEEAQLTDQTSTYYNILWGKEKAVDVEGKPLFNGILYSKSPASFGSYYAFDGEYESWGGFALSSNLDVTDKGWDYSNQFSVYGKTANKFAIGYAMGSYGGTYANPVIEFEKPVTLLNADLANANKTYHYCVATPKVGEGEAAEDIWVNLIVTGYKSGAETKKMTVSLAKGTDVIGDWKKVDFTSLGEIDKLTFGIDSNSKNSFGLLVPTFFCIDNIAIE